MEKYFETARMIAARMSGEMTAEEEQQLAQWRAASPENERLFLQITDPARRDAAREFSSGFDKQDGWNAVLRKKRAGSLRRRYLRIARYAAVIALPLCLAAILYTQFGGPEESTAVAPGTSSAMLILPSGERVALSGVTGEIAAVPAYNEGGQIAYKASAAQGAAEPEYHRMVVPRGGEYRLKLGDGSVIHLNSMSTVQFPVAFTGDTREVTLEGEACFEVAHDAARPFIVHTGHYDVRVLGTTFNVCAYGGDRRTQTTLVSGSVAITNIAGGGDVMLRPNEQFEYSTGDGSYSVFPVDAGYATAWRNGRLRLRDERLDDIMRTIGRWYDVEVEYGDDLAGKLKFGFNVDRHTSIDPLLEMFRETGKVKIERNGKKIRISSKE